MDKYIIMNKNIPLVKTTMSAAGYITEVLQIYNPEAFPVCIFTDDFLQDRTSLPIEPAGEWQEKGGEER